MKEEAARRLKSPVFDKEEDENEKNKQDPPAPTRTRHQTQPAYFGPTFWGGFAIGLGLTMIGVTIGMKIYIFQ